MDSDFEKMHKSEHILVFLRIGFFVEEKRVKLVDCLEGRFWTWFGVGWWSIRFGVLPPLWCVLVEESRCKVYIFNSPVFGSQLRVSVNPLKQRSVDVGVVSGWDLNRLQV